MRGGRGKELYISYVFYFYGDNMNNKTQEQKKYMIANIMELIAKTGKIEREFLLSTLSIETLLSKKYLENLVKDLIITNKIIIDENDILMLKNGK